MGIADLTRRAKMSTAAAIVEAVRGGRSADARRLLKGWADANARDAAGRTPLVIAAVRGPRRVATTLAASGDVTAVLRWPAATAGLARMPRATKFARRPMDSANAKATAGAAQPTDSPGGATPKSKPKGKRAGGRSARRDGHGTTPKR